MRCKIVFKSTNLRLCVGLFNGKVLKVMTPMQMFITSQLIIVGLESRKQFPNEPYYVLFSVVIDCVTICCCHINMWLSLYGNSVKAVLCVLWLAKLDAVIVSLVQRKYYRVFREDPPPPLITSHLSI